MYDIVIGNQLCLLVNVYSRDYHTIIQQYYNNILIEKKIVCDITAFHTKLQRILHVMHPGFALQMSRSYFLYRLSNCEPLFYEVWKLNKVTSLPRGVL